MANIRKIHTKLFFLQTCDQSPRVRNASGWTQVTVLYFPQKWMKSFKRARDGSKLYIYIHTHSAATTIFT